MRSLTQCCCATRSPGQPTGLDVLGQEPGWQVQRLWDNAGPSAICL